MERKEAEARIRDLLDDAGSEVFFQALCSIIKGREIIAYTQTMDFNNEVYREWRDTSQVAETLAAAIRRAERKEDDAANGLQEDSPGGGPG